MKNIIKKPEGISWKSYRANKKNSSFIKKVGYIFLVIFTGGIMFFSFGDLTNAQFNPCVEDKNCPPPTLLYPEPNEKITISPDLELKWKYDVVVSNASNWEIYSGVIGKTEDFETGFLIKGDKTPDWSVGNISLSEGTYTWRVQACNFKDVSSPCEGVGDWAFQSFTVERQVSPPPVEGLDPPSYPVRPQDRDQGLPPSITLEWEDTGAKGYYYSYWPEGEEETKKFSEIVELNYTLVTLAEGTKYFWQVQSCDKKDDISSCGPASDPLWTFTTAGTPPPTATPTPTPTPPPTPTLKKELEQSYPTFAGELKADSTLTDLIAYIYNFLIMIAGIAVFFMMVIGGFKWLSSAGDPGKAKEARDQVASAVLGLVLLFSSYLILETINPQLTSITPPWTGHPCNTAADCSEVDKQCYGDPDPTDTKAQGKCVETPLLQSTYVAVQNGDVFFVKGEISDGGIIPIIEGFTEEWGNEDNQCMWTVSLKEAPGWAGMTNYRGIRADTNIVNGEITRKVNCGYYNGGDWIGTTCNFLVACKKSESSDSEVGFIFENKKEEEQASVPPGFSVNECVFSISMRYAVGNIAWQHYNHPEARINQDGEVVSCNYRDDTTTYLGECNIATICRKNSIKHGLVAGEIFDGNIVALPEDFGALNCASLANHQRTPVDQRTNGNKFRGYAGYLFNDKAVCEAYNDAARLPSWCNYLTICSAP